MTISGWRGREQATTSAATNAMANPMTDRSGGRQLVFDEPHDPACDDGAADEENETEGAEANHHAGFGALGDTEDDRGEEREEENCSEV
jgi:hypothetical protein